MAANMNKMNIKIKKKLNHLMVNSMVTMEVDRCLMKTQMTPSTILLIPIEGEGSHTTKEEVEGKVHETTTLMIQRACNPKPALQKEVEVEGEVSVDIKLEIKISDKESTLVTLLTLRRLS
jgi:hypothetical protein